jgi:polyvinyl alcohol dehydrogenase (cytochrome)
VSVRTKSARRSALLLLIVFGIARAAELAQVPADHLYRAHCASCHDASAVSHAPSADALFKLAPEDVLRALSIGGVMQEPGKALTMAEKRSVATFVTRKEFGAKIPEIPKAAYCKRHAIRLLKELTGPRWNDWGGNLENTRFQPEQMSGMTAADLAKLKLKWAFAFPNAASADTPPVVAGGRLFVGSSNHNVYALDSRTGCIIWSYEAQAGVRGGVVLGNPTAGSKVLAFFGDGQANVYALDASSGKLIWKVDAAANARAGSLVDPRANGTVKLHDGVLIVPVSSIDDLQMAAHPKYECCTSRSAITALDAATGVLLWRTESIPEPATQSGVTRAGVPRWGPSGANAWNTPAIDTRKSLLYIGTGNAHSAPASDTSDSILALDLKTGRIVWSRQFTYQDTFSTACFTSTQLNCPVDAQGPDADFAAPPILLDLSGGKRVLLAGQKSGLVFALDPDRDGAVLWQKRVGRGGMIGGVEFGMATDGKTVYVPVSDADMVGNDPSDPMSKSKEIVYVGDRSRGGGLFALDVRTGKTIWHAPPVLCPPDRLRCSPAQIAAATLIPGAVFSGSIDGHLRAYDVTDGKILWDQDTVGAYRAVNGIVGTGGSLSGPGPVIVDGMLYANSGYGLFWMPGNVLLAYGVN